MPSHSRKNSFASSLAGRIWALLPKSRITIAVALLFTASVWYWGWDRLNTSCEGFAVEMAMAVPDVRAYEASHDPNTPWQNGMVGHLVSYYDDFRKTVIVVENDAALEAIKY